MGPHMFPLSSIKDEKLWAALVHGSVSLLCQCHLTRRKNKISFVLFHLLCLFQTFSTLLSLFEVTYNCKFLLYKVQCALFFLLMPNFVILFSFLSFFFFFTVEFSLSLFQRRIPIVSQLPWACVGWLAINSKIGLIWYCTPVQKLPFLGFVK